MEDVEQELHPLEKRLNTAIPNPRLANYIGSFLKVPEAVDFLNSLGDDSTLLNICEGLSAEFGFNYTFSNIQNVPQKGPLVVVAPHFYPILDGLSLGALMESVRPHLPVKIVATDNAKDISAVRDYFLTLSDLKAPSQIKSLIAQQTSVVIFPGGKTVPRDVKNRIAFEDDWHNGALRIAQMTRAQILPVMFEASPTEGWYNAAKRLPKAEKILEKANLRQALRPNVSLELIIGDAQLPEDFVDAEALKIGIYRLSEYALKQGFSSRISKLLRPR